MDILDEMMGTGDDVDLGEFTEATSYPVKLPDNAVKNRAALAAIVTDNGSDPISNYGTYLNESSTGDATVQKQVIDNALAKSRDSDMKSIMSILSDPNIPFEQKQQAVSNVRTSPMLNDVGISILTSQAAAESKGENIEQENSRTISTADAIYEIYESRDLIQGLKNAHGAKLRSADARTAVEMTEAWVVPFANNIITGKIAGAQAEKTGSSGGVWDLIKRYALAGSTIKDQRELLESIPPTARAEFARSLLETISENNSITFSNYNNFVQYEKAQAILDEGGYDGIDTFIDNVSPLLDIIGIGQAARGARDVSRMAKASTTAVETIPEAARGVDTSKVINVVESDLAKAPVPDMVKKGETPELQALIDERASLLGDVNTAERGDVRNIRKELKDLESKKPSPPDVKTRAKEIQKKEGISYKQASTKANKEYNEILADYEATRTRLQNQLDINAQSNKAEQQLSDLDARIEKLQKQTQQLVKPQFNPIADQIKRIEWNSVVRNENPGAPGNILQAANPSLARDFHAAIFRSGNDEAAEAMFGASRHEVLANDTMPQAITKEGRVSTKIPEIDRELRTFLQPNQEIGEFLANRGAFGLTPAERASARAKVVNDFKNAEGLTVNDAMSGPKFDDDGAFINVGVTYGTTEGGFLKAADAVRQAKYALRNYGILDSDIEILAKQGLDHVPVELADVLNKDGSYLVRVNVNHEIANQDISDFSKFEVKYNLFDRIPQLVSDNRGSVSRWLFDAASLLDKHITGAAANVSDATARFEKVLLDAAAEYSDRYAKLAKDRKAKVDDYIREANYNELAFDPVDLTARGFDSKEIETIAAWRKFWDGHFYLENYDIVRSLNANGFGMFRNGNVELYAKPIPKNSTIGKVYDPASDTVKFLTPTELDNLYNTNGHYARLRRPTEFNGETVEHMIVRNTPNEYLRKFRDSDRVLNYKQGYFQVQYIAPKFVDEIIRDANGVITQRKAVAIAGDTAEAKQFADRMSSNNGREHIVRDDARGMTTGDDNWWDVNSAKGRIAQRHRGKLLEDASGLNHLGDGSYVLNPVDSAVRAAKSIAGQTVSRPMLETAKARAMAQYKDLFPSNGMGGVKWPRTVSEIGEKGKQFSSDIADARTTWEYINYLENGYINSVDDTVKAFFNMLGNKLGEMGLSKAERASYAIGRSAPTSLGKNGVFWAYIGSNFLRQLIIQPHQVVRTIAYNPQGWLTGSMGRLVGGYTNIKVGELATPSREALDFAKFVDDSGLMDSVDKQNLVRGTLYEAANTSNRALRIAQKAVVEAPRKIGFDIGEQANMLGHAASVYDRYKRLGKDLSNKTVRDEAYSEIRAISYDMNFAGDMPYNQTTPAMILQFMQVPHKALLQMTNRRIDPATRARLIVGDVVMWGAPTATISALMGGDILPEDDATRELLTWGTESYLLNKMFTEVFGSDTNIDFSSLAPYDLTGWGQFFSHLWSDGMHQTLMNSPAGQLYFKDGGRLGEAIKSMGRYFGVVDDYEQDPETFISMMNEVMKISSGYNNALKAKILLNGQKRLDQYGDAIDKSVNHVEAWAQLLGFGTADARDYYRTAMSLSEDEKGYKEEVLKVYKDIRRHYSEKLQVESNDPKYITAVTGQVLKVFEDKPKAREIIAKQLQLDLQGKDDGLLRLMMRRSGFPEIGEVRDKLLQAPVDDDTKQKLLQRWDNVRALGAQEQNKEE